jgi:glycosyltransferase involved in cell wall biosynthesis
MAWSPSPARWAGRKLFSERSGAAPRPLSIVMVSAGFWPTVGGAERQALEQSAALAARGHKVTVLTRRVGGLPVREEIRGVVVLRVGVPDGALNALVFMMRVFAWLMLHWLEWDAVHAHLAGSPALAAALAAKLMGRPVLVKLGGGRGIGELATSSKTRSGRAKLSLLAVLRPRFLAVVPDLADEAREFLGEAAVEVLPNGVDASRFAPVGAERKAALRRELDWPQDAVVFLYTGRFSPEKRLPWFLKLWREATGESSLAVMIGDGPEREAIAKAAAGGRVVVLPPRENLADLYAAADVFVLPSTSEGLSNALLEAMSSGLAVLASRVGGTAQTVENKRDSLLFDRDDENALKAAARRLATEADLRARLGATARDEVLDHYALEQVVARLEELYR